MYIKTNENGEIIQTAAVGEIPDGIEIDLTMYKYIDGSLIPDLEKIQARQNAIRAAEIQDRLKELNYLSYDPIRSILCDTATDEDREVLQSIESEAQTLKEELKELGV